MQANYLVFVHNLIQDIIETVRTFDDHDKTSFLEQNSKYFGQAEIHYVVTKYPDRKKYYFVLLHQIQESYISYACRLLQIQRERIQILIPQSQGYQLGSICLSIMEDKQILNKIMNIPKFDLASFCISEQFLNLYDVLKGKANPLQFTTRQNWKNVKRYSTKPGIRQLIEGLKDPKIFMPQGKIFYRSQTFYEDAINFMVNRLKGQSSLGLVVKTEKLHGGHGVLIIKKNQIQGLSKNQLEFFLKNKMNKPYWKLFDIVIEQYIDSDPSLGPPFIEINVDKEGNVQFIWLCSMIIENQSQCYGIQYGRQLFNKEIYEKMLYIGKALGKVYASLKYCGNIAIDLLIDKKSNIYVGESNVRRSWPMFVHSFLERMHGKNYFNNYHIRNNSIFNQKFCNFSIQAILQKVEDLGINYTKQKGSGIVVSSGIQLLKVNQIIYFTITKSIQQTEFIQRKFKQSFA